jgi:hypothetical protein
MNFAARKNQLSSKDAYQGLAEDQALGKSYCENADGTLDKAGFALLPSPASSK